MQATVHHNSRHAACTVSEDQTGLKPYEMRVYVGTRGAAILHIAEGTKEIVVHRDNADIHLPNAGLERAAVADTIEDMVRCENCGGSGIISYNPNLNPNSFPGWATAKCTRCGGTGIEDAANAESEASQ